MVTQNTSIKKSRFTWQQYKWLHFAVMIPVSFTIFFSVDWLFHEIWNWENWDVIRILVFSILFSAAMTFIREFGASYQTYYIKRDHLNDLLQQLERDGFRLAESSEEKFVLLKRHNLVKYRPALIFLKEGAVRLEISGKFDVDLGPFLISD